MQTFSIGYTWAKTGGITPLLLSAWYGRRELPARIGRHFLPVWVLDYSFLGGMRYRVHSTKAPWRHRRPHEAHLYRPGVRFWEDSSKLHPPAALSAYITFTGGEQVGLNRLVKDNGYARLADSAELLGNLMRQVAELGQNLKDNGLFQAQALFWHILDMILNSANDPSGYQNIVKKACRSDGSLLLRRIEAYFEKHIHEKITRVALADELHMSVSSLAHVYRAETGMAPITRLMHMRINRAKHLMLRGTPLKQIAAETGFTDQFHLSKAFKHLEGLAPRVFLANWTR